jgi:hypothetical protein
MNSAGNFTAMPFVFFGAKRHFTSFANSVLLSDVHVPLYFYGGKFTSCEKLSHWRNIAYTYYEVYTVSLKVS